MKVVEKGNKITVEYVGTLEDGTVFDSTEIQKAPFEFVVGEGQVIKGFEENVLGMKEGEEKEISIPPNDAYGPYHEELVKDLPKESFPKDQELEPGMVFVLNLKDGRQIPVRVAKISNGSVTVDINHPLAGKKLNFKIKILTIAT